MKNTDTVLAEALENRCDYCGSVVILKIDHYALCGLSCFSGRLFLVDNANYHGHWCIKCV